MSDDLVCNVCREQFKSQKKLSQHSWATHSDENLPVVEKAHYSVNAFEKTHGYFVSERKMQTEIAAEKQQRMMEHLNSVHLS